MPVPWLAAKVNFVVLASLILLAWALWGCASSYGLVRPDPSYLHPFPGRVVVMQLDPAIAYPVLSLSHHEPGLCAMWLPERSPIRDELYEVELANCNGAPDVNGMRGLP